MCEDDRENEILNMMPDSEDYQEIRLSTGQVVGYVYLDNSYAIEPLDWLDISLTPKVVIDPDNPPEPCGWMLSPRTTLRTSQRSPTFPHEYEDPDEARQEHPDGDH